MTEPAPAVSASEAPARTTLGGTVQVGPRDPDHGGYAHLVAGPPEPHVIRHLDPVDLSQTAPPVTFALTAFAQMTDLHITDDQSPMRVEYLDRYADPGEPHERSYEFDSAYRPQECMSPFLTDALCRAIRTAGRGPRSGLPLAFTMVSGDGIDNCQSNELRWYLDILDGQVVTTDSGSPTIDQSVTGDEIGLDTAYWHPAFFHFEQSHAGLDNCFQAGYPAVDQMPYATRKPFTATGLGMPWFACYGNHDALVQGNVPADAPLLGLGAIAEGDFKASGLVQPLPDRGDNVGFFDVVGQVFGVGNQPGVKVTADPRRRLVSRAEFISEHFSTHGTPVGHGFTLGDDAFYAVPHRQGDRVRHLVLDTTKPGGDDGGTIASAQLQWLEGQLLAGSSQFLTDADIPVISQQPGVQDLLFVIHSHHAIRSCGQAGQVLERLLLRYPNVVLMVNGHSHRNVVDRHFRPWPTAPHGGFYEVGTSAVIDYPSQGRLIEIVSGRGVVSIVTTMVDIDAPLVFDPTADITQPAVIASLGREIAANDLQERDRHVLDNPGTVDQRNVRLLLPAPFALPDPPVFGSPLAATAIPTAGSAPVLAGIDQDDQVHVTDDGGGHPIVLDGSLRALSLAADPDGAVHLFGVNAQGTPWRRHRSAAGVWSPWLGTDGQFTAVACARNGLGDVELFAVQGLSAGGPDSPLGTLWRSRERAAGGGTAGADGVDPWQLFADGGFTDIAACTDRSGNVVVAAVSAATSTVLTVAQTTRGDWSGATWQFLGAPATAVTVACGPDGVVQLVLTDDDGRLQIARQTSPGATTWTGWADLDHDWARFTIRRLALIPPSGDDLTHQMHLYGANADGQVFARATQLGDPHRWTAWGPLPLTVRTTLPLTDAPQVTWPGDQRSLLGAALALQLHADGGAGTITWTADSLPHGLTCSPTGLITGVPVTGGPPTQIVTVTATDTNLASGTATFSWTTVAQVPDLLGARQQPAVAELHAAGFTVGAATLSNQCLGPAGIVVGQSHPAGEVLPEGTEVRLTVSTGLNTKGKPCEVV